MSAPPAIDKKRIYAIFEIHKLPINVPKNVGPPPINPNNIMNRSLGFLVNPVSGLAIPNPSVAL